MDTFEKAQKICSMLNVTLDEEWEYGTLYGKKKFRVHPAENDVCIEMWAHIDEDNLDDYSWEDATYVLDSPDIIELILNPQNIIHQPRWSKNDIDDALAAKRLFPDAWSIERTAAPARQVILRDKCEPNNLYSGHTFFLKKDAFPSVRHEDGTVVLDTIIAEYKGAKDEEEKGN